MNPNDQVMVKLQKLRSLVILWEFMPKEFQNVSTI
ncbi:unnamed protein product, partial [Vitis vinifera]